MTTKTIINTFIALAVAATLTVGLAACTQAPAPAEKPTATEAPVVADPPVAGEIISDDVVLAEGQATFALADGRRVVVTATEPMPALVIEEIVSNAVPPKGGGLARIGYGQHLESLTSTAGKTVIVVAPARGSIDPGGPQEWFWTVLNDDVDGDHTRIQSEAVAVAEQWKAAQPDPRLVEIIVLSIP